MLKLFDDYLPLFLTTIHKAKVNTSLPRSKSIQERPQKFHMLRQSFIGLYMYQLRSHIHLHNVMMQICMTIKNQAEPKMAVTYSGSISTYKFSAAHLADCNINH